MTEPLNLQEILMGFTDGAPRAQDGGYGRQNRPPGLIQQPGWLACKCPNGYRFLSIHRIGGIQISVQS